MGKKLLQKLIKIRDKKLYFKTWGEWDRYCLNKDVQRCEITVDEKISQEEYRKRYGVIAEFNKGIFTWFGSKPQSPQPVWDYALRIKDQIKQVHMSERPLSESEIKLIPDYAWVDTYYLDKKWSLKSWLKQYDKQKNLLATQTSTLKGDLEESIKKMEAMKYNEPLDNEMRIVNMMVNSCVMIIREDILNSL